VAKVSNKVDFDEEDIKSAASSKRGRDDDTIVSLDMNLDDYEDFEPLPNGGYPFTVLKAELRTSDKGNEYYYQTLQIHPDDFPPDYARENAPDGLNLNYSRLQKPTASNRRSITAVKNYMRAIGVPTNVSTIDPAVWEGKTGKVFIKKGTYNGEPTNEIKSIESLDD
jgi:hypothetical protein